MIVHLVRHGETAHNRDSLGLGREDALLTGLGRQQVQAVADALAAAPLTRVLSSPLGRALEMARLVAAPHGLEVEVRDELAELDVGETEGIPLSVLREKYAEFLAEWLGPNGASVRMPGGESLEDLAARVRPLIEELRGGSGEVVVASHNFVIRVFICEALGIPLAQFRSFAVDLASISTMTLGDRRVSVATLNDCCHLERLNLDPAQRSL